MMLDKFYGRLSERHERLYNEIIACLAAHGYHPHKVRANIVFNHESHNKQMAKIGFKRDHKPFFALRFSACRGYSDRFSDIVRDAIVKYPSKLARCFDEECGYCKGEPETHSYAFTFPDGTTKNYCGAYALTIPDITAADLDEIKTLISEEHEYLMKHEATHTPPA
jgi:hypothetical protein